MADYQTRLPYQRGGAVGHGANIDSTIVNLNSADAMIAYSFVVPESKTLSKVHVYIGAIGGTGGSMGVQVQTNSSATELFPSGTKVGSTAEETATTSAAGWVTFTIDPQASFSAYTRYWIVLRNAESSAQSTNYPRVYVQRTRHAVNDYYTGHQFTYLTKTGASWANAANTRAGQCCVCEFTDGSLLGDYSGGLATTATTNKIYGTNYLRIRFTPLVPMLIDAFTVNLYRNGTPTAFVTFLVKDDGGTTLATAACDMGMGYFPAAGVSRTCVPIVPLWLLPGKEYSLWIKTSDESGSSSNYWSVAGLQADQPPSIVAGNPFGILNIASDTSSNSGTDWTLSSTYTETLALSVVSFGDFSGEGTIALDSSVRDGASGASVKLRSNSAILPFTYRRWYVAQASLTGYSVKMRRNSTYIPTTHSVALYKAGSQIGTTLSADASANDTFYTYSLSGLSISSGDVIEIRYTTMLSSDAAAGQDYAWFDTEAFS